MMWVNDDLVKWYNEEFPAFEDAQNVLAKRILDAIKYPSDIMDIDWEGLEQVTGISTDVWDMVYATSDWFEDFETAAALEALKGLVREIPTTPIKDYL
jgi:hypothetical protein